MFEYCQTGLSDQEIDQIIQTNWLKKKLMPQRVPISRIELIKLIEKTKNEENNNLFEDFDKNWSKFEKQ